MAIAVAFSTCKQAFTTLDRAVQPELALPKEPPTPALDHICNRYLRTTPEAICGSVAAAAHPTRCFFVDATLWTTPALAPTAVVPTLPASAAAECGYQQLELGDEEQLARYPVLQAMRSGISLDAESYTKGSYHTVPIVPGAPVPWNPDSPELSRHSASSAPWLQAARRGKRRRRRTP